MDENIYEMPASKQFELLRYTEQDGQRAILCQKLADVAKDREALVDEVLALLVHSELSPFSSAYQTESHYEVAKANLLERMGKV